MPSTETYSEQPVTTLHSPQRHQGKGRIGTFAQLISHVKIPELLAATRCFYNFSRGEKIGQEARPILDSDLLDLEVRLYHSMKVWVQEFQTGKWTPQSIRCTVDKDWYNTGTRNDWVWWTTWHERQREALRKVPYGALRGRLPVKLRCIFKIRTMFNETFQDDWLALIELTEPCGGGQLEEASSLPRVMRPKRITKRVVCTTRGIVYRVIPVGAISGAAHCIPLIPSSEGPATSWYVNTHIDHETWNYIWD